MKRGKVFLFLIILLLFLIPVIYADVSLFDWITGRLTQMTTTANVTIASTAPVILNVTTISEPSITEAGVTGLQFNFTVMDVDGAVDLNNTAAAGYFNASGEITRSNTTCANIGDVNATTRAYWCNVSIYWYDAPTTWTVNATIADNSGNVASDISSTFVLTLTNAFTMSPTALTWPSVAVDNTNKTSNNDPLILNNTGNGNITLGNINITGYNLLGETQTMQFINASNFTVDITGDAVGNPECSVSATTSGVQLINETGTNVTGAGLPRGNFTVNDNSTAQELLFFCLTLVTPGNGTNLLPTQSYSTANTLPWSLRIAL